MSTTTRQHQQVMAHDRTTNLVTTGVVAVCGAIGFAIALGLARVAEYAEKVEEDEYCHGTGVPQTD